MKANKLKLNDDLKDFIFACITSIMSRNKMAIFASYEAKNSSCIRE